MQANLLTRLHQGIKSELVFFSLNKVMIILSDMNHYLPNRNPELYSK